MDAYVGKASLQRTTFRTSRLLDFFSEKELVAQTGHYVSDWPLVVVKELIDNALDACEETGVAPKPSAAAVPHGARNLRPEIDAAEVGRRERGRGRQ
jgi:hypothetical protein